MKVLCVHNRYMNSGGEDSVFEDESALLDANGIQVVRYTTSNSDIQQNGLFAVLHALWHAPKNASVKRRIGELLEQHKPDIVHVHNTWFALGSAVFQACGEAKIPVVQTLHNARYLCLAGILARRNEPCLKCVGALPKAGLRFRCYRNSWMQSLALYRFAQDFRHTAVHHVDGLLVLTQFARDLFLRSGFPPEKLYIKPNFVDDQLAPRYNSDGPVVFVGRLSSEKGADLLVEAWRKVAPGSERILEIIGDGPQKSALQEMAESSSENVVFRGAVPFQECRSIMQNASVVVLPSRCYEGFPRVLVEAYSMGKPVIATRLGALEELIREDENGLLFEFNNSSDLADKLASLLNTESRIREMGQRSRELYQLFYTSEKNLERLLHIYERLIRES